jgi:hypothetical protein
MVAQKAGKFTQFLRKGKKNITFSCSGDKFAVLLRRFGDIPVLTASRIGA